jgi:hypothetical protein
MYCKEMKDQQLIDLYEAYASIYETKDTSVENEPVEVDEDAKYDRNRKRAAQRAAARNEARKQGKTGNVPGVGYVSPRPEGETYRDSSGVERHKTGARMPQKEEYVDEAMSNYEKNRQRAAQRAAARNEARKQGKTGAVPGVGYVSPRPERETWTDESGKERHKTGARMPQKEETDLFDYILEYLVAEGYADTNENALVIMANMSEEWRESIVEGKDPVTPPQKPERPTALPGETYGERQKRMKPSSQVKGA